LGPLSLVSTTESYLEEIVAAPVYKTDNKPVVIRYADHVATSIRKSRRSLGRYSSLVNSGDGVFIRLFSPENIGSNCTDIFAGMSQLATMMYGVRVRDTNSLLDASIPPPLPRLHFVYQVKHVQDRPTDPGLTWTDRSSSSIWGEEWIEIELRLCNHCY
jgi:hypothetical protein